MREDRCSGKAEISVIGFRRHKPLEDAINSQMYVGLGQISPKLVQALTTDPAEPQRCILGQRNIGTLLRPYIEIVESQNGFGVHFLQYHMPAP